MQQLLEKQESKFTVSQACEVSRWKEGSEWHRMAGQHLAEQQCTAVTRWGAGRLLYKILPWAEQLSSFIFVLTSSDPGSRTLTALASCSVTGCTNKAFPGEKHKHGCGPQGCISSEKQLCALGLSASHSHFRGLLRHAKCLGSLSTGTKGLCRELMAAWVLFCYGTGTQLGCIVYPAAWRHFWVPHSLRDDCLFALWLNKKIRFSNQKSRRQECPCKKNPQLLKLVALPIVLLYS